MKSSYDSMILFIVGNSRSGTTMLGRILGNHSQVYTFGELHFFEQMVQENTLAVQCSHDKLTASLERLLTSARDGLFTPVKKDNIAQMRRRYYRYRILLTLLLFISL